MTAAVVSVGLEGAGGAAAGYLSARYPDKKIAGFDLGVVLAASAIGLGLSGVLPSKMGNYALEVGGGAAAFELGKIVASKTSPASGVKGIGAVGALPPSRRTVTAAELARSLQSFSRAA